MTNPAVSSIRPATAAALSLLAWHYGGSPAEANPVGGTVAQGKASFSPPGSQLTVNVTTTTAVINWQSFNIGAGETTTFVQPSSSSVVWNQINDANPSSIAGSLNANGYVILQNQNGFAVGGAAAISAHGLIMTTSPTPPPNLAGGGAWTFNAPPLGVKITNLGQINITGGGPAFLIADDIENQGTISAPGGKIGLYAGEQVLVSLSPNGLALSAPVTLPQGSVDNEGKLIADAGTIAAQAQTVNQNGLIQANSVQYVNGSIELVAGDKLTLGANSDLEANGITPTSSGGAVSLQAGDTLEAQAGSTINVSGSAQDGTPGQAATVTVEAGNTLELDQGSAINAAGGEISLQAATVNQQGLLQANSVDTVAGAITIAASGAINLGAGSDLEAHGDNSAANPAASPGGSVSLQAGTEFADQSGSVINVSGSTAGGTGGQTVISAPQMAAVHSSINAQANAGFAGGTLAVDTENILLNSAGSPAPGVLALNVNSLTAGFSQITLQAAGNLELNTAWTLVGADSAASLNLTAGKNLILDDGAGIAAGNNWNLNFSAGSSIYLNGTSFLLTRSGNLSLLAPALDTLNGAGITLDAGAGNLELGGIWNLADASAAANLNLTAGNDLTLDDGVGIVAGKNWKVNLTAGSAINLSGSTVIQTQNGNIVLKAPGIATKNGADTTIDADSGNIELGSTWTLADANATSDLNLSAGNTLTFDNGAGIAAGKSWNLNLTAGSAINLSGNNSIQMAGGNILLEAPAMNTFNQGALTIDAGSGNLELDSIWSVVGASPQSALSLSAGNNITFDNGAEILAGTGWNINLTAGNTITINQNSGIAAPADKITLNAAMVNQDGSLSANTAGTASGVVEIDASQAISLGANSILSAQGDATSSQPSPGGFVVLQSGNTLADTAGSTISVAGRTGGQDGIIEIFGVGTSAATLQSSLSSDYALLINPYDLTLSGNLTDTSTANPNLNVNSLANYSQIDLHALDNIALVASPLPGVSLSLAAGNTITLAAGTAISEVNEVSLTAGRAIIFNGAASLQTQAGDISLMAPATQSANGGELDLTATTGNIKLGSLLTLPVAATPTSLNLTAGDSIMLNDGAAIVTGNDWNLNLTAGTALPAGTPPAAGSDGIYLNGSAYVAAGNGNINLRAANEVQIADITGDDNGIRTLAGGSIAVTTEYGDVNTGGNNLGFSFNNKSTHYTVSPALGGISTQNGGNVTITAGGNVTSYTPSGSDDSDAGTGAFGANPGNVTITAGGNVYGHYVLADNGVGTITAGGDVGVPAGTESFALSLIDGTWNVNAPNGNIYIQEVRNPNGVFNVASTTTSHFFNYGAQATVNLNAGDGVYFTDETLPRPTPHGNTAPDAVPVIFPPILNVTAGAGGVVLQDNVTLFPSLYQNLTITTTALGNLMAIPNDPAATPELLMSDSSNTRWITTDGVEAFSHYDNGTVFPLENPAPGQIKPPGPVQINIAGSMDNLILITSKATDLTVAQDMYNSGFSGQNLRPGDATILNVGGQIGNSSTYSTVGQVSIPALPTGDLLPGMVANWNNIFTLAVSQSLVDSLVLTPNISASSVLEQASVFHDALQNGQVTATSVPNFGYDASTGLLTYKGQMDPVTHGELGNANQPIYILHLVNGQPVVGADGRLELDPVTWAPVSAVDSLYTASTAPLNPNDPNAQPTSPLLGYRLGGPGQFDIMAGSISLGDSSGILSCGVTDPTGGYDRYAGLASLTPSGATVNVKVAGDLTMLTSTIAALGGGDVNVTSTGGSLDLGSDAVASPNQQVGQGIFTSGEGNVSVTAYGDVNIDGSRIATFNGGDISVTAQQGTVNVGSAGATYNGVYVSYVDPSGQANFYAEQVYGNGIVANTLVPPKASAAYGKPGSEWPADHASVPGNITVSAPRGDIMATLGGITQEALDGNISGGPTVTLTAGTPASGTAGTADYFAGYAGNIDLGESGVIGGTVFATAYSVTAGGITTGGNISGLIISRQNSTINAAQNFNGAVIAGGNAGVTAGGSVGGIIVGVGGASVSGGNVTASVLGQNVSVNGGASQSTLGASAAATSTSQAAANQSDSEAKAQLASDDGNGDDDKKKKKLLPMIQRVKRVTVILPKT